MAYVYFSEIFIWPIDGTLTILLLWVRVDQGVITLKEYSTLQNSRTGDLPPDESLCYTQDIPCLEREASYFSTRDTFSVFYASA